MMYVLIIIFSSLSFVMDEPLFSISVDNLQFHNKARCVAAQEWVLKNTEAKAHCFKK
jgi:hypothetical protein